MIDAVTVSKGIAILPGPRTSFLDHLMPLCDLWDIPLLCTDEWVAICAQTFYPSVKVILSEHATFQHDLEPYSTFVTVEPCRLHPRALQFGEFLYRGSAQTVAGFHGNPSKFREEYWIERYADEDTVLVYGQYLVDYLKEKGVLSRLKNVVTIGNLRQAYYEKHRTFFDAIMKPHLFPQSSRKTLLWAPTWTYPNPPSGYEEVLDHLPSDFQILVKLHPFMYRMYPEFVSSLKEKYAESTHVRIMEEIPLIYPLLQQTDIYIGDASSVAYDFLAYDRPLFILGKEKFPWATTVSTPQDLFKALHQKDTLSEMRQNTYRYVFKEGVPC